MKNRPRTLIPQEMSYFMDRYKKVLDKKVLSANLLFYSTYIAIFEVFKKTIIENPKGFLDRGILENQENEISQYKSEIISRINKKRKIDNKKIKSIFMASCDWSYDLNLLTFEQYQNVDLLVNYRNIAAHEMAIQIYDEKVRPDFSIIDELRHTFSLYAYKWFIDFDLAMGTEELQNSGITYEEFSKSNPFGLVLLYNNLMSLIEYKEDGFIYLRDRS